MEIVGDVERTVHVMKMGQIFGHGVGRIKSHDYEENQVIVEGKRLGEIYGQCIKANECYWATKEVR